VMELQTVDDSVTTSDEAIRVALGDSETRAPSQSHPPRSVTRSSSSVQGGDGGPAGQPTVDPSAGGMPPGETDVNPDEVNIGEDDIDNLNVVDADDPRLGLTNHGKVGPDDWAANTGPTRNAGGALQSLASDGAEQGLTERVRRKR